MFSFTPPWSLDEYAELRNNLAVGYEEVDGVNCATNRQQNMEPCYVILNDPRKDILGLKSRAVIHVNMEKTKNR